MSMWTAIALISIAAIFCGARRRKYKHEGENENGEKLDQLQQQLDQLDRDLRDRVETLERIVTDRKENLKRRFDYLEKAS